MTRPFLALLLGFLALSARAQKPGYLVMIDAEQDKSFQVRIDDTVISSSQMGHLLIPNLKDSTYVMAVQFPRQAIPEQEFTIRINKKDCGFQLRRADSDKWILYNWQTKETKVGTALPDSIRFGPRGTRREDSFSFLMAAVVNDTAVLYNTYSGAGFGKDSLVLTKKDSVRKQMLALKRDSAVMKKVAIKKQPELLKPAITYPYIKRLREVSLKISRKLVFLDVSGKKAHDTVTVFIFFEKEHFDSAAIASTWKPEPPPPPIPDSSRAVAAAKRELFVVPGTEFATDNDVDSLRSLIVERNSVKDKVGAAEKMFTAKTFSTIQIRLIAGLFSSDKGKYRLLEASAHHVSDTTNFSSLSDMLTNKGYLKKFQNLQ